MLIVAVVVVAVDEAEAETGLRLRWWWNRFLRMEAAAPVWDVAAVVDVTAAAALLLAVGMGIDVEAVEAAVCVVALLAADGARDRWWLVALYWRDAIVNWGVWKGLRGRHLHMLYSVYRDDNR